MIFSAAEWSLAIRYLRARREEGSLSIMAAFSLIGIALGVATLIIVMAVMGGFRIELLDRIVAVNGRLAVIGGEQGVADYQRLVERIVTVPHVAAATPMIEGQGILARDGRTQGILVRGIRPQDLPRSFLASNLKDGKLDFADKRNIVVGRQLLEAFNLKVGDQIDLISSQTIATPLGLLPRTGRFRIVGAFEIGMYEYDTRMIVMPFQAAQNFFDMANPSMIEIRALPPADIAAMERELATIAGPYNVVVNWEKSNAGFFALVETQANVLFLILTLIILVAAFNIVSSLFILVRTKTAEIGVLRTIGAGQGTIMRVFLLAGLILGGIGTIAGVILGVAFAANIEVIRQWLQRQLGEGVDLFSGKLYFLTKLPAVVDYGTVAIVAAMALGLTLLAALYPSWRAAKLDPLAALRDE